jgi:hypothetical protein
VPDDSDGNTSAAASIDHTEMIAVEPALQYRHFGLMHRLPIRYMLVPVPSFGFDLPAS